MNSIFEWLKIPFIVEGQGDVFLNGFALAGFIIIIMTLIVIAVIILIRKGRGR